MEAGDESLHRMTGLVDPNDRFLGNATHLQEFRAVKVTADHLKALRIVRCRLHKAAKVPAKLWELREPHQTVPIFPVDLSVPMTPLLKEKVSHGV